MDYIDFISGFYTALSLCCGVFFLSSRKRRAPFREAFGWLSIYCALENFIFYTIYNSELGDQTTRDIVGVCYDMSAIPFIALVASAIVNQDMKAVPFRKRWIGLAIAEIPIAICIGIGAFTQYEWRVLLLKVMMVTYIATVFIYSTYNLVTYEKRLPDTTAGKEASIKWLWYLVALMAIEAVLYFGVGLYITNMLYYVVLCAVTGIATYFINKQSPIDTRQMFETAITQKDGSDEDNGDEPESPSLTRKDMESKVKEFMVQHPKFGDLIAERAVQKLTVRDMYLCIMIIEGKRATDIADTLAISSSSVDVARYRLRTKLNLNKGENLAKALKAYV